MIKTLSIENFRCIKKAEIDFGPLTALVGPNASGKSTVLAALTPFRNATVVADSWRHDPACPLSLAALLATGQRNVLHPHTSQVWLSQNVLALHLDVERLRDPNTLANAKQLATNGVNVTNVFATLTRKQQEALSKRFCRLVPVFADIDAEPIANGQQQLRMQDRWNQDVWYTPQQVSDGSLIMLAYLTLQYHEPPVDILTIEEPDRGLHPYLMEQLVAFLRELSSPTEAGVKPIQVVLATHSAELLEYMKPEEVRFLDRNTADGALVVNKIDTSAPGWEDTFRAYRQSLGGVWLSGGVGGVPGR